MLNTKQFNLLLRLILANQSDSLLVKLGVTQVRNCKPVLQINPIELASGFVNTPVEVSALLKLNTREGLAQWFDFVGNYLSRAESLECRELRAVMRTDWNALPAVNVPSGFYFNGKQLTDDEVDYFNSLSGFDWFNHFKDTMTISEVGYYTNREKELRHMSKVNPAFGPLFNAFYDWRKTVTSGSPISKPKLVCK